MREFAVKWTQVYNESTPQQRQIVAVRQALSDR